MFCVKNNAILIECKKRCRTYTNKPYIKKSKVRTESVYFRLFIYYHLTLVSFKKMLSLIYGRIRKLVFILITQQNHNIIIQIKTMQY